jgi:hypothetical protein
LTPADIRLKELAEPFKYERELAFFVVNLGRSREEFEDFTEKEKLFIQKEYETKFINDTTWTRNAVLNGVSNAMRKKGAKFIDLFKRKNPRADIEFNENAINTILDMEKKKGKSWVQKIYEKMGFKPSKEGGR